MTATFAADVTLADAQRRLSAIGQWLPIDGPGHFTLGSLVEHDSTGPLRLGYGAWRDLLLGVQFTNGDGGLITAGGMTVKNVAGYDLTKFMVGQRGVFGTLVTLTTRTYRLPARAILARFSPNDATLPRLIPSALRPHWTIRTRDDLLCGYPGDDVTLNWYATNLPQVSPLELNRRTFEEDVAHRASLWRFVGPGTFRASLPPSRIAAALADLSDEFSADPAFGIVTGQASAEADVARLRDWSTRHGGTIRFTGVSSPNFDISVSPAEHRILSRLKEVFDPQGRLAPLPGAVR
jgi:hypothetical protein